MSSSDEYVYSSGSDDGGGGGDEDGNNSDADSNKSEGELDPDVELENVRNRKSYCHQKRNTNLTTRQINHNTFLLHNIFFFLCFLTFCFVFFYQPLTLLIDFYFSI